MKNFGLLRYLAPVAFFSIWIISGCDVEINPDAPTCTDNDKQDYATFISGAKGLDVAYNDLRESSFLLEDWPADEAELTEIKNNAETGRVDLETFCSEIRDALINTINDNPDLQAQMETEAIVQALGVAIENEQDRLVFKTGSLADEVQIGDTVVIYLGEEHLPRSKASKIEEYNNGIQDRLGEDYLLPVRPTLHYCAIDAFPVLIANQLISARKENEEAMAFLVKIDPIMVNFDKYLSAVPETID